MTKTSEGQVPVDNAVADLCKGLGQKIDAGILEELISLFNNGVLQLQMTVPRSTFDKENMRLTVSQCMRISFEGKQKISNLESLLAAEKEKSRKLAEALDFLGNYEEWKDRLAPIREQADIALAEYRGEK